MSEQVTLRGLTAKGKQRVKQWGERWVILKKKDKVSFSDLNGDWLFVQAVGDTSDSSSRWVNLTSDKDFEVNNVK